MFFSKKGISKVVKRLSGALCDAVFPRRCVVCGETLDAGDRHVCRMCMEHIMYSDFSIIRSNPMEQKLLRLTGIEIPAMSMCIYTHEGFAGKMVEAFKYHHRRDLVLWAGEMTGREMKKSPVWSGYDCLVPIPLHGSRQKKRGYNQSAEICRGISSVCGMSVQEAIVRDVHTKAQARLSKEERWKNARGIFSLAAHADVKGKKIIIVDDVFTTGATLSAAAHVVHAAGAKSVAVVTFAAGE